MENRIAQRDKQLERLEQLIRNTPAEVDLTRQIMDKYEERKSTQAQQLPIRRRRHSWRMVVVAVAAALVIVTGIAGTGLISPAAAEALRQIPGLGRVFQLAGDLGLKAADEKGLYVNPGASDTQEGMTVSATAVTFDGTRVSVGLEGESFPGAELSGGKLSLDEAMTGMQLQIDGQPLNTYAPYGSSIGPIIFPVPGSDKLVLEFSDLRNQGGTAFPQQFELAVTFNITGVSEPFVLDIPVKLNTKDNLVLNPFAASHYDNILWQVVKVESTPVTTNITTRLEVAGTTISELQRSGNAIGYDLLDDQGNRIQLLSGNGSSGTNGNVLTMDSRFVPFTSLPESITIRPYHYVYQKDSATEFQLDADGQVKVEYIPELEITVPLKAAGE